MKILIHLAQLGSGNGNGYGNGSYGNGSYGYGNGYGTKEDMQSCGATILEE